MWVQINRFLKQFLCNLEQFGDDGKTFRGITVQETGRSERFRGESELPTEVEGVLDTSVHTLRPTVRTESVHK